METLFILSSLEGLCNHLEYAMTFMKYQAQFKVVHTLSRSSYIATHKYTRQNMLTELDPREQVSTSHSPRRPCTTVSHNSFCIVYLTANASSSIRVLNTSETPHWMLEVPCCTAAGCSPAAHGQRKQGDVSFDAVGVTR